MAPTDLHETSQTCSEMALAAREIAICEYALAWEFDRMWSRLRPMATDLRQSAAMFERMRKEAVGPRPLDWPTLERLARAFEIVARRVQEIAELAREMRDADTVTIGVLFAHIREKLQIICSVTRDAALILDLRLS